jgi:4-hydroxy-4-methyl-2-oxoglutarate aldolase
MSEGDQDTGGSVAGPSTDDELAGWLERFGSATLGESGALTLPPRLRAVWPGAVLAAPALPVSCTPGDNLAIHVAVARAPAGAALVVDVGDIAERGYFGEVLTTAAQARRIAGLVIDGGVRDVAALRGLGFPVFASMVSLPGAQKVAAGTVGSTVQVAGVRVSLGDWVVGDVDGVVIIPGENMNDIVAAAQDRSEKEIGYFESLRSGATTVELLGLDSSVVDVELP